MTIAVIVDYRTKSAPIAGIKTVIVDNTVNNRGFAAGANMGIKKALKMGADKVLLVNPDLRLGPHFALWASRGKRLGDIEGPVLKFKRPHSAKASRGETVFDFGGRVNWWLGRTWHMESGIRNQESGGDRSKKIDLGPQRSEDRNRECDYVSGACMMVDRKVFEKIGLFDERFFLYFEDVDFCLRAKAAGFKVAVNPKIVIEHQIEEHRFSINNQKFMLAWESNRKFILKWISPVFWPLALIYLELLKWRRWQLKHSGE